MQIKCQALNQICHFPFPNHIYPVDVQIFIPSSPSAPPRFHIHTCRALQIILLCPPKSACGEKWMRAYRPRVSTTRILFDVKIKKNNERRLAQKIFGVGSREYKVNKLILNNLTHFMHKFFLCQIIFFLRTSIHPTQVDYMAEASRMYRIKDIRYTRIVCVATREQSSIKSSTFPLSWHRGWRSGCVSVPAGGGPTKPNTQHFYANC